MKILAVANNPGGANAIVPVIKWLDNDCLVIAEGKAKNVFARESIEYIDAEDVDVLTFYDNHTVSVMLAGTSNGETIDKALLKQAKKKNIPSVYVLDFWSNYWIRFSENQNNDELPDTICVMDEMAKQEMVKEGFPGHILSVTGNPFFDHFTDAISNDKEEDRIVFMSQPFSGDGFGYDETKVLTDVMACIPENIRFEVRLHPRDPKGKYDSLKVIYDTETDVNKSVSRSKLIIGMNSMVLFQAAIAGKRVISYQPGMIKDILPTNSMGLSTLVTDETKLCDTIKKIYTSAPPQHKQATLVEHATENVLKIIKSYE